MDILLTSGVSLLFTLLFATAGLHKWRQQAHFVAILRDYRLLPASLAPALGRTLAAVEVALALLWPASLAWAPLRIAAAVATLMLLAAYALAMAINLLRGRRHIDCGCGFGGGVTGGGGTASGGQTLSGWLLLRNLLLMVLAVAATAEPVPRALTLLDGFSLLMGLAGCLLLYGAAQQLLANRDIILSWRRPGAATHA